MLESLKKEVKKTQFLILYNFWENIVKLNNIFIANAIIALIFGLGFVLLPGLILSLYGFDLKENVEASTLARLLGADFLGYAALAWFGKDLQGNAPKRVILIVLLVSFAIGTIGALIPKITGHFNILWWSTIAVYLTFSAIYTYFLLFQTKAISPSHMESFGDFAPPSPGHNEYLKLAFSPSSLSVKTRWKNNGLSANFLADYAKVFFPKEDEEKWRDFHDSISYISNELLENAMKYNNEASNLPVFMFVYLYDDYIRVYVKNCTLDESVVGLKAFIDRLQKSDPQEMYMQQLEAASEDESMNTSGMGLLSIMHDYEAKIGWRFEKDEKNLPVITTMIQIDFQTKDM